MELRKEVSIFLRLFYPNYLAFYEKLANFVAKNRCMKRLILSFLLILAVSAAFAQNGEMPEGQLTHFEFTTTYRDGKFLSQCSTATSQSDGRVKATCFDFYDNMDSCTVYASRDVLADVREIIADLKARHADGSPLTPLEKINQELVKRLLPSKK